MARQITPARHAHSSARRFSTAGSERKAQSKKGETVRTAAADGNPGRGISDFGDASEPSSAELIGIFDAIPGVAAKPHPGSDKTRPSRGQKRGVSGGRGRNRSAGKSSSTDEQPVPPQQPKRSRDRGNRKGDKSRWGFDYSPSK
jgi:hypothetical protein